MESRTKLDGTIIRTTLWSLYWAHVLSSWKLLGRLFGRLEEPFLVDIMIFKVIFSFILCVFGYIYIIIRGIEIQKVPNRLYP